MKQQKSDCILFDYLGYFSFLVDGELAHIFKWSLLYTENPPNIYFKNKKSKGMSLLLHWTNPFYCRVETVSKQKYTAHV